MNRYEYEANLKRAFIAASNYRNLKNYAPNQVHRNDYYCYDKMKNFKDPNVNVQIPVRKMNATNYNNAVQAYYKPSMYAKQNNRQMIIRKASQERRDSNLRRYDHHYVNEGSHQNDLIGMKLGERLKSQRRELARRNQLQSSIVKRSTGNRRSILKK